MRDITARYPRALEAHSRIAPLDAERVEALIAAEDAAGLETLAQSRVRELWLDDQFVKAGTERALEPHPRLALLPLEVMWSMAQSPERVAKLLAWGASRHEEIELEAGDRYRYGWRGDPGRSRELGGGWKRAVEAIAAVKKANPRSIPKILCMGGNGSSKSEFAAWYAMKLMVEKPRAQVAVLCPSQTQARKVLMERLFDNLPAEWRPAETGKAKSGITGNISYTRKMGFTENMFLLPNGSRCTFYFYLEGDPKSIEGDQLDLVIADEEVPAEWLEACEFRLARTAGTLMAMFTPISGYIPAVTWFRGGARVIEQREAPLLKNVVSVQRDERGELKETRFEMAAWHESPPGTIREEPVMMPLLEYGADPTKRVIYFWTQDCCYPAFGYETLSELLRSKRATVAMVKTRAYGWPSKVRDARFPILDEKVHAIAPAAARAGEIPKDATWYMFLDPAEGRNHVMQWYAKTRDGREILAREWPQQDDFIPGFGLVGPWAVDATRGKALDGVPGPAQQPMNLTPAQYVAEMDRVEAELGKDYTHEGQPIHVTRRIMDSRGGDKMVAGRSYFTEFAALKNAAGRHCVFEDASGKELNPRSSNPDAVCGVSLIDGALGYDTQKPVGPSNHPRLMVVYAPPDVDAGEEVPHGCANSWDSLKHWTGADGLKGARKDFIDLFHYAQREEMEWEDTTPRPLTGMTFGTKL
jgi:hypothetical protein